MQRQILRIRHARPATPALEVETIELVSVRDGGRCVRCGSPANLEVAHIVPVQLGGSNEGGRTQPWKARSAVGRIIPVPAGSYRVLRST